MIVPKSARCKDSVSARIAYDWWKPDTLLTTVRGSEPHKSSKDPSDSKEVITISYHTAKGTRVTSVHVHNDATYKEFPSRNAGKGKWLSALQFLRMTRSWEKQPCSQEACPYVLRDERITCASLHRDEVYCLQSTIWNSTVLRLPFTISSFCLFLVWKMTRSHRPLLPTLTSPPKYYCRCRQIAHCFRREHKNCTWSLRAAHRDATER